MNKAIAAKQLQPIARFLQQEVITELEQQGHIATGNLKDSIEAAIEEYAGGFKIVGRYLYYGEYVDTGRKPGTKRVPIDALIAWIRVKKINLNGKRERDVAFAIQTAIFKKGIPTDGDDKKKRFVSRTLEATEGELKAMIESVFYRIVKLSVENMIEETQKELIQ